MLKLVKKIWLPFAGAGTSMTVAAENVTAKTPEIMNTVNILATNPLLYYFLIGAAGAAGGLMIKVLWIVIKDIFPTLKKKDK